MSNRITVRKKRDIISPEALLSRITELERESKILTKSLEEAHTEIKMISANTDRVVNNISNLNRESYAFHNALDTITTKVDTITTKVGAMETGVYPVTIQPTTGYDLVTRVTNLENSLMPLDMGKIKYEDSCGNIQQLIYRIDGTSYTEYYYCSL